VEAIDEVSHEQNMRLKLMAIEDFDSRLVGRVLAAAGPGICAVVLPDHPVPLATGKHTRTPVPVAVRKPDLAPDNVAAFNEIDCRNGSLGALTNGDLMNILFGTAKSS
jgi:2,3-bisphosphoglycerate-independent phosphoglycerate mutase